MVDIACEVAARAAVDRPLGVHSEEILAITFVDFFVRDAGTCVFDDSFAFRNRFQSKQSKTGACAPYFVFSVTVIFTQCSKFPLYDFVSCVSCNSWIAFSLTSNTIHESHEKHELAFYFYRELTRSAIIRLPTAMNINPNASSVTNRSSSSFKRIFLCVTPL